MFGFSVLGRFLAAAQEIALTLVQVSLIVVLVARHRCVDY